jgi:DNA-binding response OmpR family regulator
MTYPNGKPGPGDHSLILIADDDRDIARAIATLLQSEGYRTVLAYDGTEALAALSNGGISLIILDIMMPKMDGLTATLKIRERANIPILILSAKTEDSDKILGLSMGADDYVTKPYSPGELTARVRSLIRRYTQLGDDRKREDVIRNGRLTLETEGRQLLADGEPVHLTATEYKILELFMRNQGIVFPAEKIYERVWNEQAYAVENTVMVHIRRLREKIEINPSEPEYVKVVWGIGYKMEKHRGQ